MIWHLALRELKSLFISPLAWAVLAVIQLIVAYQFLNQLESYVENQARIAVMEQPPGITDLVIAPTLGFAAILLLLIVPLMTMRIISEERRSQTLPLLFSAPLSTTQIILGKYLGIILFLTLALLMLSLMPLSLGLGTPIDYGQVFAGLIGLFLLLVSFAAAGLYMSSLTRYPALAAIGGFGLLLFLWIINLASGYRPGENVLHYLSLLSHYEPMLSGSFYTSDIIYYLLFTVTFIVLSIRRLERDRLPH